ncbi:MAG: CobW family GTP-binding protein [Hyphomicrobiaceae bacterium]
MIPVTLLTGFLGSGKTTLLSQLLRQPALARTAVIINEFGEIGLDHELVASSDEQFVELTTGCLCCKVQSDLVVTLEDMLARRTAGTVMAFERVVIETTGLADPAPILHALMTTPSLIERLELAAVVTTVDAMTGVHTLATEPISRKQAAVADRVVITKTDLTDGVPPSLAAQLDALNAAAPRHIAIAGNIEASVLFAGTFDDSGLAVSQGPPRAMTLPPPQRGGARGGESNTSVVRSVDAGQSHLAYKPAPEKSAAPSSIPPPPTPPHKGEGREFASTVRHVASAPVADLGDSRTPPQSNHLDGIATHVVVREAALSAITLTLFLEALAEHCGVDLLRLKGLAAIAEAPERPAVVHGVQHVFHPLAWLDTWPSADRRTRLVFITRGIPGSWIDALLAAIECEVTATISMR